MAKSLSGSKTLDNLKAAFAGESQANRRYLYFAKVADVEGFPEIAGNFKETADGETGHAHGHLDYMKSVGDPATGLPIGNTEKNLKAAVAGESVALRQRGGARFAVAHDGIGGEHLDRHLGRDEGAVARIHLRGDDGGAGLRAALERTGGLCAHNLMSGGNSKSGM